MVAKVSFCTTCMNRLVHLRKTLPRNIADNADYPDLEFVLVDFNSTDGLVDWVASEMMEHIRSGKLVYYRNDYFQYFHMSRCKNIAHCLATGDILCNMDADNYAGEGFAWHVYELLQEQDEPCVIEGGNDQASGKIVCYKKDFELLGGYDESFNGWGYEDNDFIARAKRLGYKIERFSRGYTHFLKHSPELRDKHQKLHRRKSASINRGRYNQNSSNNVLYVNQGGPWGQCVLTKNFQELVMSGPSYANPSSPDNGMWRIGCFFRDDKLPGELSDNMSGFDNLADFVFGEHEDAHVLLTDVHEVRRNPGVLDFGKPVFVFDLRKEDTCFGGAAAELSLHPSVAGVLCYHLYRDRSWYVTDQTWHKKCIYQGLDGPWKKLAGFSEKKIVCDTSKLIPIFSSMFMLRRFRSAISTVGDVHYELGRKYDINFVGSMGHKDILVPAHRQKALDAINELSCKSYVRTYWLPNQEFKKYFSAPEDGKMKTPEYMQSLMDSKICVSPWGNSESCIRDFEALYAGCVLIKPDTDFCETWPDIYQEGHYVKCRPDFSDLKLKVDSVLGNWEDYREHRQRNRDFLEERLNPRVCAYHFLMAIRSRLLPPDLSEQKSKALD